MRTLIISAVIDALRYEDKKKFKFLEHPPSETLEVVRRVLDLGHVFQVILPNSTLVDWFRAQKFSAGTPAPLSEALPIIVVDVDLSRLQQFKCSGRIWLASRNNASIVAKEGARQPVEQASSWLEVYELILKLAAAGAT
jgi:hypothetical protein